MYKRIVFLIILCFSQICFSQTDHNQKFQQIYTMLFADEYEKAKQQIDFELIASKNETDHILGYVALMYYLSLQPEKNKQYEQIKILEKIEHLANNNLRYKAYVSYGYILLYKNLDKKVLFTKTFNNAIQILNHYSDENFLISNLYFIKTKFTYPDKQLPAYVKGLEYAKKSNNNTNINLAINELANYYGSVYQESKKYKKLFDSAHYYLQRLYQNIPKIEYAPAQKKMLVIYNTNYATTLMNTQKTEEGVKIYKKVLEENKNNPIITFAIYNNLGRVSHLKGNYQQALNYYLKAYALKDNQRISSRMLPILEDNISTLYKDLGKYKEALHFEMSKAAHTEKELEDTNKILDAFYQSEQKKSILEQKNKTLRGEQYLYVGFVIFSTIIIILLVFLIQYRKKINIHKNELLKVEQSRLKIEQELIRKKYLATTLQLSHKNSVLTEIKNKTKEQSDINIDKLLKEEQFVDHNFDKLQQTVFDIHPDFFHQLKIISKNKLTPLDLKYASFIYLHMDNHQISNYTKSDLNAVRVAKHRLKKKLGIAKEESIENFIQNIKII